MSVWLSGEVKERRREEEASLSDEERKCLTSREMRERSFDGINKSLNFIY